MASRHMRRSRRSSPLDTSSRGNISIKKEAQVDGNDADMSEGWTEPPLRPPAPSFEDYKGLERHGVLEHMAPLGTLPGNKVRSRLKQHEPPRRAAHLKNGDARGARDEVNTPEPAPPVAARRSEPRRPEERPSKVSSSRERDEDYDYTPKGITRVTSKANSTHSTAQAPKSRTAQEQMKLRQIVDTAIKRANDLDDFVLGIAVRQLYEESLHNRTLADLLDAVLTQKPTQQQTHEFQSYIKGARKKIKAGEDPGAKSVSKSPAAKNLRTSVTRHFGTPKDQSIAPALNHHSSNSSHQLPNHEMGANGGPSKEERPSKRIKRSKSDSSDSSLSSLDSAVEEFAPTIESIAPNASNLAPTQRITQPNYRHSMGPRLGSFSTRPSDSSTRRPIISPAHVATSPTPEDLLARKRDREKLKQDFSDHIVRDSAIRAGMIQTQTIAPSAALAERGQQPRLRNGTSNRIRRDDYEALESPSSSNYGDLLVPPPAGASRGATPTHLGRPPKAGKKAARIKMSTRKGKEPANSSPSPMKKRTGVTAGIGRATEAESNAVSYGRTDDNQDQNSDLCSACSGSGKLLCCDGCWRAFHFTCFDPPLEPRDAETDDGKWFCYQCRAPQFELPKPERSVFGELVNELTRRNPVSFNLPGPIRDYFEGVKTGDEGEYEEASVVKANKVRGGYEELPNNFKLKDNKENSVLCFRCGESALFKREIIPCDYCNLSWHLDCLDPPLATSPVRRNNGRSKNTWMCPNHIDHELAVLGAKAQAQASNKVHPKTGRRYKIRRPKNAHIIDIGIRRGFKNNGLIEIENDASDDDSANEREKSGVIYRVPELGIKLDFIDRVKRANEEEAQQQRKKVRFEHQPVKNAHVPAVKHTKAQHAFFTKLTFSERKAALNLTQLAYDNSPVSHSENGTAQDDTENLIKALIAEAPAVVEKLCADDELTQEKKALESLIDKARRRLEQLEQKKAA